MRKNSLGMELPDDAMLVSEKMKTITAEEFGKRMAKVFDESRSSTALFFVQCAFRDCEDDNGIYSDMFHEMFERIGK